MLNKIIVISLLLCSTCFAGDYICFDKDGKITQQRMSIDGYIDGTATREDCLKVTRSQFEAISKYSIVKDGKLLEMTLAEKTVLDEAEALALAKAQAEADKALTVEKLIAVLEEKQILTKTEVETKEVVNAQIIK